MGAKKWVEKKGERLYRDVSFYVNEKPMSAS